MKKILTLTMVLAMTCSMSFAGNAFTNALKSDLNAVKNAAKQDVKDVKNAVKQDAKNRATAQASTAQAKKAEKIKQIDAKLADLNSKMTTVKNNKNITETERTLQTKALQNQIDFYNKQKAALK